MTEQATTELASDLLAGMRTSLAADGYGLGVEAIPSGLRLTVSADSDTCSDCLIPVDVFRGNVSTVFERGGLAVDTIEITYPSTATH